MKRTTTDKMMRALGTGRTEIMHTKRQLQKWSKAKLIREIIKLEAILLRIAIKLYKAKLPRIPYGTSVKIRAAPLELSKRQVLKKGRWTTKRKTKRKFSRKQLAAQRLFAKRSRAGTLKRRRR